MFDRTGQPAAGVDSGKNGETRAVLDPEGLRFYRKMPETVRRRADGLPMGERAAFVGLWGRAEARHCPHGSERLMEPGRHYGFRVRTTKDWKALRNWALEAVLDQ
ncbi:hypothetical protein PVW46_26990 [Mameliella sp. AT18]|uniref:hypothetical protein n=1 Tax=Mameliella sp. AT18 TaxID=3028385 RepID=UPI0008411F17|nr:hypothetical protein [Mameliella sp. AT18]MDD9733567.1 hypothetical protein [Mameliella sp. AT18]ODM49266.1 hypothetical protein A9320_15925 [Ruegeria sp. PBVC088]